MPGNVFIELSIIMLIAVAFAGLMRLLRQPLIIGYILTGIAASPYFLNVLGSGENLGTFAQLGVALLLFMVGLNLNPKVIKELGKISLVTGIGQIAFTAFVGYFLASWLGFSVTEALYISVAVTFSSTIIIMKLLSDKGDTDKLYGRISTGFLLVQDIIAIIILMIISSTTKEFALTRDAVATTLQGIGVLFLLFVFGIYLLPQLLSRVAKSQEFLLLFSIGWCLVLATLLYSLKFSFEIGALIAGITLSLSPYRYEITAKMKPLRDFFIVLFFILLGSQMLLTNIQEYLFAIIVFSLFILIGNPFILMIIMGLMGYTKRTSFFVGLTVAQVSEFSFIMVALGVKLGHISQEVLSYVTIVGLLTIAGSTYLIIYADKLYNLLEHKLDIFERKGKKIDSFHKEKNKIYDILLFGYNRMGRHFLGSFKSLKKRFLIIDFNPETVLGLTKKGYECKYGDAADAELLEEVNISNAKMIISTIPNANINALLITKAKEKNKNNIVIVVAQQVEDALDLYDIGATYVVLPHIISGDHASTIIKKHKFNMKSFVKERLLHLKDLRKRKKM